MSSANPLEQQKEYLIQRAAYITSFAQKQHARQGRGIVVIGWPAPNLIKVEDFLSGANYVPEDALALTSIDPADELVQAVRKYNPTWQALIMCVETIRRSFNVHVLTAIQERSELQRPTSH